MLRPFFVRQAAEQRVVGHIAEAVPAHVLTAALFERFSSRGEAEFADKVTSAMRYEFGGHFEKSLSKGQTA